MKRIFRLNGLFGILFLCAPVLFAQGWTDLPNTHLQTVCPPNGFTATYGNYTMPTASPWGFMSQECYRVLTSWSSATVDTKRNRLLFMGDGHDGQNDNAVYSVDLATRSASTATCGGQTCSIYSDKSPSTNPSSSTDSVGSGVITRLNDPSVFIAGAPMAPNPDGTPHAMQTYQTFIYLPKSDSVIMIGQGNVYASPPENHTWILNLSTMKWAQKSDAPDSAGAGRMCVLDTTAPDDQLVCFVTNTSMYRYVVNTDTWSLISNTIVLQSGNDGTPVLDPDRRMIYVFGPNYDGSGPKLYSVSLTGTQTDLTSSVTGCGDLMAFGTPSATWDPSLHRIVGYVPQTVASRPSPSNEILIFNPATLTCVVQPQLGGSGPPARSNTLCASGGCQGTMGHFSYVPGLAEYILINNNTEDVWAFKLGANATHGLGASTLTCVDRDGDGYGTGPGCLGPDADDQDANVHSGADFLAKWGTLTAGLQHLGYKPSNIWYISTTGNNTTGAVNDSNHPFATCCGTGAANPSPGDMVLLRGGTYNFWAYSTPAGTPGRPIVYMSYPGELAYFGSYPGGFNFLSTANVVLDGMKFNASGGNACVSLGTVSNMEIRHVEAFGCEWGIDSEQPLDFTIEDSVLHDAASNGGQHGIYLTNHSLTSYAQNVFVRRNLLYNNPYTGFQFNGKVKNLIVEQNIAYNNDTAGFSWLSGVTNSIFRSNVSINNEQGLVLYQYQAFCDVYDPTGNCPYGENNNLIENFTSYSTGTDRNGVPYQAGFAAITVADDSTRKADMGHNTYRNINVVNYHINGYGLGPFSAADASLAYFSTSTFDHVNVYNAATPPGTTAFNVGSNYYTCAQAAAASNVFGSVTNCNFGDPQFVSASTSFATTPASFNLQVQSTSPVVHAGNPANAPLYDLIGNPFANQPTLGAYEYGPSTAPAPPPPPPTSSACDINRDGTVNNLDVVAAANQVVGLSSCGTAALRISGQCTAMDVQRVIVAVRGGLCVTGQ